MDGTRALSWLTFDGAPAVRLGGPELATTLLDLGAVGASAEMLGGSGRVLEMAVQYAKDRVQFDQPIGSFQAIKHRCADMVVDVEGMRSATWYAAWALSANDPDGSAAASTAKVWSSDAAKRVMASGLQVHGGIGFTWEHDLHLYMKRSQFDRLSYGDAVFHRERLAALLRSRTASGSSLF
jgi:alkylation response protein AidB-like acyl-CoA dehydrogenase